MGSWHDFMAVHIIGILLGNFGVMRFDMEISQGTLGGGCFFF